MSWRDQLTGLTSNVAEFANRVKSELTAENEIDPTTELQYHKDQAIKFERDLIKCQAEVKEKNQEIEALTDSVREAFEEVEVTRQSLLQRLAAKELQLEKAQHEIEQLRDFQGDTTGDDGNNELAIELELVRAEKANLSDELTALNTKLQYYQNQLAARLEPSAETLRPQDVELLQEELMQSNSRIESLRQEMTNLLEKNHSLLNECTERQEFCRELEHRLSDIQSHHHSPHPPEVESLRAQVLQLQAENEKALKELSDANSVKMELEKRQSEDARQHRSEVEQLQEQINQLTALNSQLSTDVSELKTAKDSVEQKQSKKDTAKMKKLQDKFNQLVTENEALSSEVSDLKTAKDDQQNEEYVAQIEKLTEQIGKLEEENEQLLTEVSDLKTAKDDQRNEEYVAQIEKLTTQIGLLEEENKQLLTEVSYSRDVKINFEQQKHEVQKYIAQIEKLTAQIGLLEEENDQLHQEISTSNDGKVNFEQQQQNEVKKYAEQIEKLTAQIGQLEEENEQLLTEVSDSKDVKINEEQKYAEQIEKLTAQIGQLEEENSNLQQEISSSDRASNDAKIQQYAEQIEKLTSKIGQLEEENDRLQKDMSSSNDAKIQQYAEQIEKLTAQIGQLEEENSKLQQEIFTSNDAKIQQYVEQIEKLTAQIGQLEEEIATSNDSQQHNTQRYIDQIEKLTSRIGQLEEENGQHHAARTEMEQQQNEIRKYLEEVQHFKLQVAKLEEDNKNLQSSMSTANAAKEEFEQKRQQNIQQYSEEIQNLKSQLEQLDDENTQLRNYSMSVKSNLEQYQHSIQQYEEQSKHLKSQMERLEAENSRMLQEVTNLNATRDGSAQQQNVQQYTAEIAKLEAEINRLVSLSRKSSQIHIEELKQVKQSEKAPSETMSWRDQLTGLTSNVAEFAQRVKSELTAEEEEVDPSSELQYHKNKAIKLESILRQSQEQNERNQQEMDEVLAKIQAKEEKIDSYRIDLEKLQAENGELHVQIGRLNSKIDELQSSQTDAQSQLQEQSSKNEQKLRQQLQQLQGEKEAIEQRLMETEATLNEMFIERKNMVESTEQTEIYRRYTQERNERKQQELDDALSKIQQKELEIQQYRATLDKQQIENDQLHKRIDGINATIKDLQASYAENQSQLRAAEKMYEKGDCDLREQFKQLQVERDAIEKQKIESVEKLKEAESKILDLCAEVELLEERCQHEMAPKPVQNVASTSSSIANFVIPPELRQFIVSAITCDEQQRADGAMLLASLIGATPEEKNKVEESYKLKSGWTSFFGGSRPTPANHPQNTREFLTQFVDFLERESSSTTMNAATVEVTEPVRIEHDLHPQAQHAPDKELNSIIS